MNSHRRHLAATTVACAVVALLSACGGGRPSHSSSASATASISEKCERLGGSALLPGSEGRDTSSVPDDTPSVCGCWTTWMAESLPPTEVAQMNASIHQTGSLTGWLGNSEQNGSLPTVERRLEELTGALQQCDLGHKPAAAGGGASQRAASEPASLSDIGGRPTGTTSASSNASSPSASRQHVSGPPGVKGSECAGRLDNNPPFNTSANAPIGVIAAGLSCSAAEADVKAYLAWRYEHPDAQEYGWPGGLTCRSSTYVPVGHREEEALGYTMCTSASESLAFVDHEW